MTTVTVKAKDAGKFLSKMYYEILDDTFAAASVLVRAALENAADELKKPGKKITYPVKWDSEKQRKAFFATNGFGRGIPTQRTDKYRLAWKVKQAKIRGKYISGFQLTNAVKYSKWVGGDAYGINQSRIHQKRWKVSRDVIDKNIAKLPADLRAKLGTVARKAAQGTKP